MDVMGRYNGLRSAWPVRAFEQVVRHGAGPALRQMMGPSLTPAEIARRQAERLVRDAEIGASAVSQALAGPDHDTELLQFGGAMVLGAVAKAGEGSDLIVQEAAVQVALSVPPEVLADNPLVGQEVADQAAHVIGEVKSAYSVDS